MMGAADENLVCHDVPIPFITLYQYVTCACITNILWRVSCLKKFRLIDGTNVKGEHTNEPRQRPAQAKSTCHRSR
jgi:hypothetical protein